MALSPGTFLGPYEVLAPAGSGGMGEVYRARDTRLDRIVALKVMPAHLASDPALRERFEREARTISHLNHPNICTLHDVGSDKGVDFLVMEYLEGETLAQHLSRGALTLAAALHIAMQIAEALDRAHHAGIVHRDLKPSNIFLVRDAGVSSAPLVKLLDFGLAKSVSTLVAQETASPTLAQALTGQGTILGTLQYMSPEQLEGRDADARADIFAFGAVLYEMLTRRRAFDGKSQASVIASILSATPPPVSSQQPVTPAVLDHLVGRALEKDPVDRWASMHDVLLQLSWIATHGLGPAATAGASPIARRERRWGIAASAALLLALAAAVTLMLRSGAATPATIHFEIPPPEGTTFLAAGLAMGYMPPVLSHDGTRIITPAIGGDGVRRLWLRRLDAATPQLLAGTDGGFLPFWSPDDRSVGFFAEGRLVRLDLPDGTPRVLCDAPSGFGGTWNRDGVIVFSPAANVPLLRVSASGGVPVPLTTLDPSKGHVSHRFPDFLPDGHHFLYLARSAKPELSAVLVGSLDSDGASAVMSSSNRAVFVPPHWLVFQAGGAPTGSGATLFVQRFDPAQLRSGEPIALRDNIVVDEGGQGAYSFSDQGTFSYRLLAASRQETLNWYARSGAFESTIGEPGNYTVPRISPDGRRLAVAMSGSIWVRDLMRGTAARLTSGPADCCPVWSPDSTRIAFRKGTQDLAVKTASGTGTETMLLANGAANVTTQWTPAGDGIIFQSTGRNRIDTLFLPLAEPRTPKPVLQSPFNEEQAQLSPDGRWIAFTSDESGRPQVYVQDFPALAEKWLISTDGGADPQWRADGAELFFIGPDHKLMAVPIRRGVTFEPGIPVALFQTRVTGLTDVRTHYQVTRDGQRFLVNTIGPADRGAPVQVVVNWQAAVVGTKN